ncbi:MAG: hypothetical protein ACOX8S_10870 [Christensenellales bacterium]|jgi:hypothetical protein
MDFFLQKEKQRHLKSGAKSAYVMPYPYEKGHFCLYYGDGRREYVRLCDGIYEEAARAWRELEIPGIGCGAGEEELRLMTYMRLIKGREGPPREPTPKEKALIRLLMDARLPGMKERILRLLGECYSDNIRENRGMGQLEGCIRKSLYGL